MPFSVFFETSQDLKCSGLFCHPPSGFSPFSFSAGSLAPERGLSRWCGRSCISSCYSPPCVPPRFAGPIDCGVPASVTPAATFPNSSPLTFWPFWVAFPAPSPPFTAPLPGAQVDSIHFRVAFEVSGFVYGLFFFLRSFVRFFDQRDTWPISFSGVRSSLPVLGGYRVFFFPDLFFFCLFLWHRPSSLFS